MDERTKKLINYPKPKCLSPGRGGYAVAFKYFNITDSDLDMGLRHVKAKVKREFNKLAKRYHPDTAERSIVNGWSFQLLHRWRDKILNLKIMPLTLDNIESILDIQRGYKSTRDYDLPNYLEV